MKKYSIIESQMDVLRAYGLELGKLSGCTLCKFANGDIMLTQGRQVEQLFLVVEGKVKVCMLAPNGKNLTLCYYVSSGILGDVELMQEEKTASATSIAILPTTCITIPLLKNLKYLTNNLVFMNWVAKGLSDKLLNSSNAHIASALYSSEERLCSYILMSEHNGLFSEVLSDVSKSIGISYRHLFRVINDLCKQGILEKTESGFKILDKQFLQQKCTEQ